MEEAEPQGLVAGTQLRPYQKQSLAFMLAIENSTDASLVGERPAESLQMHLARAAACDTHASYKAKRAGLKIDLTNGPAPPTRSVRGGWLCDEVGMGSAAWSKWSNPSSWQRQSRSPTLESPLCVRVHGSSPGSGEEM